ncbi:MAG: (Fe-S)-binding protein, partial [Alistipes sp.]|nr:(Fe-S)-binding protein [Alistipes sp.]
MTFFADFCIPFIVGEIILFTAIAIKYIMWLKGLPKSDKKLILKGAFSPRFFTATWEVIRESLLHHRIFKVNPLLGYMHMSLAFGWFLLISVGWIETIAYLGFKMIPLHGHVFFKYFIPLNEITAHKPMFDFVMDFLLLFVLSGVTLAWIKRMRSRAMGMKKTTQHISFDRIALTALWFVFPVRLLCESVTSAIYGGGSFLTGGIGSLLAAGINTEILHAIYEPLWWLYSCALGIFFVAMPFSRYMHIFTEIPLIFLRHFRLRPEAKEKSYDNFEV